MTQSSSQPESGFSLGFFFGFLMGSFGTMLLTTESGRLILEKVIELGEEKTRGLLEEGKTLMSEVDLESFWHDETEKPEKKNEVEPVPETESQKTSSPKTNRRFFRRS